ncbi:24810_t:CDS:1, partial [Gigaspora rosea]
MSSNYTRHTTTHFNRCTNRKYNTKQICSQTSQLYLSTQPQTPDQTPPKYPGYSKLAQPQQNPGLEQNSKDIDWPNILQLLNYHNSPLS